MYTQQTSCRNCGSDNLVQSISLGNLYPSNFVSPDENLDKFEKAPLDLVVCRDCELVQLGHTYDQDEMYRNYFYLSGLNGSMVSSLKDIVECIKARVDLKDGDTVVDIGANDGTMLSLYKVPGLNKVAVEPSFNIPKVVDDNVVWVNDYFTAKAVGDLKAKVITAIAMFYDLPSPRTFVKDVASILSDGGIFVVQLTDLVSMLRVNAFDNICHEHLEYYTFTNLQNIFATAGLEIFDVSFNDVNGGSIRVYAGFSGKHTLNKENIDLALQLQKDTLKDDPEDALRIFKILIDAIKRQTVIFLEDARGLVLSVMGLGASTKGNTLLQYFEIDDFLIRAIAEVNPDKYGKVTLGTSIPIIEEKEAFSQDPSFFFVLPWHFIEFFLEKKLDYLKSGGEFFVPLPLPSIYRYENGKIICQQLPL